MGERTFESSIRRADRGVGRVGARYTVTSSSAAHPPSDRRSARRGRVRGLLLEQLTLPDTLDGADADALVAELVDRLVPAAEPRAVAGGGSTVG